MPQTSRETAFPHATADSHHKLPTVDASNLSTCIHVSRGNLRTFLHATFYCRRRLRYPRQKKIRWRCLMCSRNVRARLGTPREAWADVLAIVLRDEILRRLEDNLWIPPRALVKHPSFRFETRCTVDHRTSGLSQPCCRAETPVERGIVSGLAARPALLAALQTGDLRPQPGDFDFGVLPCAFRFAPPAFRLVSPLLCLVSPAFRLQPTAL